MFGKSAGSAAGKNQPASGAPLTTAPGSSVARKSRFLKVPTPPADPPVSRTFFAAANPCCCLSSATMAAKLAWPSKYRPQDAAEGDVLLPAWQSPVQYGTKTCVAAQKSGLAAQSAEKAPLPCHV